MYAKGPVLHTREENGWKYFITFKQGSMPALWREYRSLRRLSPANRKRLLRPGNLQQDFAWVEGLEHLDEQKRRHRLNAFQCLERGGLLSAECKRLFGSLRNLARRLAESIRNRRIPLETLDPAPAVQIRLNTS